MKLEIGAGESRSGEYLHTDSSYLPGSHIEVVCRGEELPFRDGVFECVLMWGVFEHFTYSSAGKVLSECYRVLKAGGCVELTAPDLEAACRLVLSRQFPFDAERIGWRAPTIGPWPYLNYSVGCLYGGQDRPGQVHQSGWTRELLELYLKESGFTIYSFDTDVFEPNTHLHFIAGKN